MEPNSDSTSDQLGDADLTALPTLPPATRPASLPDLTALPTLPPTPVPTPPPILPPATRPDSLPDHDATAIDVPVLASAPSGAVPVAEPVAFDAKAMVESQKHFARHPSYGNLPKATPESLEAANALRATARRKRRRSRVIAWMVASVMLGGILAAGWFGYRAYQDDQDQLERDRRVAQIDGSATAPGALTPLGNQQAVIDALDDLNSGPTAGAGGLLDAVDDARAAVDGTNGTPTFTTSPPEPTLAVLDVRPEAVERLGTQLDDLGGFERHVVDGRLLSADDPAEFARFVALTQALPQADPQAPGFVVLPDLDTGEIGFAIIRDGDRLIHAVIVSEDPRIHVDHSP